jgi:hypothetical protein
MIRLRLVAAALFLLHAAFAARGETAPAPTNPNASKSAPSPHEVRTQARATILEAGGELIEDETFCHPSPVIGIRLDRRATRAKMTRDLLLALTRFENIEFLYLLSPGRVEPDHIEDFLKRLSACRNLRRMALVGADLTNQSMQRLACLGDLRSLDLSFSGIPSDGIRVIA